MKNKKNYFFYICLLFSFINIIYITNFFIDNSYLPSPFVFDKNNTFMDLFNPLNWSINGDAYTVYKSIYPPLSFILLSAINYLFEIKNYDSALDLRADNKLIAAIFLFLYLMILFYVFNSRLWRDLVPSIFNRNILLVSFLFSTPILFALERGNIIFITIPFFLALITTKSELTKYISLAFLVNIKPYFILYLLTNINNLKDNRFIILKYIFYISILFIFTAFIYKLNLYNYFYTFIDFTKKTPIPFFETLSMPLSLDAISAFRHYSSKTHSLSSLFYFPTIINKITIIYLIYLLFSRSLEYSKYTLGATLVILNFSTSIGGYGYLFYIPIIPLLLQEKNSRKYIYLLFILFILPLDIIKIGTLHNNIFAFVDSYLGQVALKNIVHPFTLGSIVRPITNYLILFIFTYSVHQVPDKSNIFISAAVRLSALLKRWVDKLPYIQPKTTKIFTLICLIIVCVFYNSLFSFGSSPLTEGWFIAIAHLITIGKIPYVDFHLYLTPLYPLGISWYTQIFGDSFYSLRVLGLLITTGIWSLLYLLLNRKFSPSASFLAATTSMILYESGVAFISYDFTQVLIFLFLCTTYSLCLALQYQHDLRSEVLNKKLVFLFFAGLFSSLSFFVKQSNGALIVIGAILCAVLIVFQGKRHRLITFFSFTLGGILPAGVILLWLINNGALFEFWNHIFDGAISAKGTISNILFGWFIRVFSASFNKSLIIFLGILALFYSGHYILKKKLLDKNDSTNHAEQYFYQSLSFFLILFATIYLAYFHHTQHISLSFFKYGSKLVSFIAPIAICTTFFMLTFTFFNRFKLNNVLQKKELDAFPLLGIMIVSLIWGNGTSGGIGEMALFLPFSIFICLVLEIKRYKVFLTTLILVGCVSLVSYYCVTKFNTPYYWWGLQQGDVRLTHQRSTIPLLANLKLSEDEKSTTDLLVSAIVKNDSGDIFAFPNIPIVYLLSNRWPDSKVLIQWFDFLPDQVATQESIRILESPPKTIVNLRLPEFVWNAHEQIFRNGNRSGQRDIQNAITALTIKSALYTHSYSKILTNGYVLDVWNLKDTN